MGQVIIVKCKCGNVLFKYYKDKKGKLIKCYLHEIRKDYTNGITTLPQEATPTCPKCSRTLGTITLVHGKPALKVKQSTISMRT